MKPFELTSAHSTQQASQRWERHFPFLKLQFFTPLAGLVDDTQSQVPLGAWQDPTDRSARLTVDPAMSVRDFERLFQETFGLRVEVLRKMGYTWDDTEYTRHWTLHEQNSKGKELAMAFQAGK
ncbi:hypothetical protein GCM10027275_15070 [Rhabdobacter roseus]|uniref:Uncharacterized protein n=1 Tax=Rhabdobacter roseus TaxID=1655419 RepID=A0A840TNU8_9BACT|nr:hypothetical protein [Rhabdobacter roseus]MBB5283427.1 hypothetical protein [Rhabdobacter roseus]